MEKESDIMKQCLIAVMVVACFTAGAQALDEVWTGAVDDNWDVPNNWYGAFPDGDLTYIGSPAYPNAVVIVTDSNRVSNPGTILVGGSDVGSLTVNGTLTANSSVRVGAYDRNFAPSWLPFSISDNNEWKDPGRGTLTVNGRLNIGMNGNFMVGSSGYGTVYLNPGGVIDNTGEGAVMYLGEDYYEDYGEEYEFHMTGGTLLVRKVEMTIQDKDGTDCNTALFKISGGTIMAPDPNWYGRGWWTSGGTFEVAGPATMLNMGIRFAWQESHTDQRPTLKISGLAGTESKLTVGSFRLSGAYLDVSEANMPSGWTWVTIVDAGWHDPNNWDPNDGFPLAFTPGTDTNEWKFRADANNNNDLEIMLAITGDMDGSAALNTDDVTPFVLALTDPNAYIVQYGLDPNLVGDVDNSGKLDADDISPFVTKLTGGAASVPEPTALALLTLAGAVFIRRRRRAKH